MQQHANKRNRKKKYQNFHTPRIYLGLAFLLFLPNLLVSQSLTKKNELGLGIGYSQSYFKDLNFSPLNYRGRGGLFQITYIRKSSAGNPIFEARIDLGNASLSSDLLNEDASYLSSHVYLVFFQKIHARKNLDVYLGPAFLSNLNSLNYEYLDYSSFSFIFAHSLNFHASASYQIGTKQQVSSSFSLPLLTFLVRPPYNGFDEELDALADKPFRLLTNGALTSLNTYRAWNWEVAYRRTISNTMHLLLTYTLVYQSTQEFHRLIHLQNQLKLGISINL